jgi:two-component system chemotaxis response regulator CheB
VPLTELAALLVRLTLEPAPAQPHVPKQELDLLKIEVSIARHGNAFEMGIIDKGILTSFTCPDCHGALTQLIEGNIIRYRCHTGHAYTLGTLLSEVTESVESLLYQSMRGLEETKMLLANLGKHFEQDKQPKVADLFFRRAEQAGKQARTIHESILKQERLSSDLQFQRK